MRVALLDVNMLLALAWDSHVLHDVAHQWADEHHLEPWATCPLTEAGFVRISSNTAYTPHALSPLAAREVLRLSTADPHHVFWPDEFSLLDVDFPELLLVGHKQVTDAYLLALAIRRGGHLVTLDRGVERLLPHDSPYHESLCVLRG